MNIVDIDTTAGDRPTSSPAGRPPLGSAGQGFSSDLGARFLGREGLAGEAQVDAAVGRLDLGLGRLAVDVEDRAGEAHGLPALVVRRHLVGRGAGELGELQGAVDVGVDLGGAAVAELVADAAVVVAGGADDVGVELHGELGLEGLGVERVHLGAADGGEGDHRVLLVGVVGGGRGDAVVAGDVVQVDVGDLLAVLGAHHGAVVVGERGRGVDLGDVGGGDEAVGVQLGGDAGDRLGGELGHAHVLDDQVLVLLAGDGDDDARRGLVVVVQAVLDGRGVDLDVGDEVHGHGLAVLGGGQARDARGRGEGEEGDGDVAGGAREGEGLLHVLLASC